MRRHPARRRKRPYSIRKAPLVVGLFFLTLFLAGIASGEPNRVLEQAKQICLSCIGIG